MTAALDPPIAKKSINRCCECSKRVGLTGFKCRCDQMFCSNHRLPEDHRCTFDFKAAGKAELIKNNPVIQPAKLVKV